MVVAPSSHPAHNAPCMLRTHPSIVPPASRGGRGNGGARVDTRRLQQTPPLPRNMHCADPPILPPTGSGPRTTGGASRQPGSPGVRGPLPPNTPRAVHGGPLHLGDSAPCGVLRKRRNNGHWCTHNTSGVSGGECGCHCVGAQVSASAARRLVQAAPPRLTTSTRPAARGQRAPTCSRCPMNPGRPLTTATTCPHHPEPEWRLIPRALRLASRPTPRRCSTPRRQRPGSCCGSYAAARPALIRGASLSPKCHADAGCELRRALTGAPAVAGSKTGRRPLGAQTAPHAPHECLKHSQKDVCGSCKSCTARDGAAASFGLLAPGWFVCFCSFFAFLVYGLP